MCRSLRCLQPSSLPEPADMRVRNNSYSEVTPPYSGQRPAPPMLACGLYNIREARVRCDYLARTFVDQDSLSRRCAYVYPDQKQVPPSSSKVCRRSCIALVSVRRYCRLGKPLTEQPRHRRPQEFPTFRPQYRLRVQGRKIVPYWNMATPGAPTSRAMSTSSAT
jgi:hypothetical protein